MSADLLALLARMTLTASAAIAVILLLRRPLRAAFGAQIAYASWLMAPLATLAVLIPARQIAVQAAIAPAPAPGPSAPLPLPVETALAAQPASQDAAAFWPMDFDIAPIVLFIWLAGVFFSLLLVLRGHQRVMRNADAAGPAVIGFWQPRIVLPRDFEQR